MTPDEAANANTVRPIVVATLHRPTGTIGGIQKHFNVLLDVAKEAHIQTEVISPFSAPAPLTYPLLGVGKGLEKLSAPIRAGPLHAWYYERVRLFLMRRALYKRLEPGTSTLIYAQDPVSAEAALSLRAEGYNLEIVLAVHVNLSAAEEWVGKGAIKRSGRLYYQMILRDRRVLPRMDRLVFVSHFMEAQVLKVIPEIADVPRYVVPNFVPRADVGDFREVRPITTDLITIGTLEPRKNQAFLLHVLAATHAAGHPYSLSVVGDGAERPALEALSARLGLRDFVTFTGATPRAWTLLPEHRAYVHAAHMESFGIVLLEAMAVGKPVFAAPVGGVPEVFQDNVHGRYWNLNDPQEAAQRLIQVLERPETYERMSQAARQRQAQHFSVEAVRETLLGAILGTAPKVSP